MEQFSLFQTPHEKGSAEWSAFDAVRDGSSGFFRVATPKKKDTGPQRGTAVPLKRFKDPHRIFPKPAHSS